MKPTGALSVVLVLSLCAVAQGGGGDQAGGSFGVSLGGGSLIQEGGSFDDLQGDLRGPLLTAAGLNLQTVGYRAAYKGALSLQAGFAYRVWKGIAVVAAAELAWPRYRFEEYILFTPRDGSGCPSLVTGDGSRDLKVKETSYFFAPTIGLRLQLAGKSAGPYVQVEWGKVFRHADLHWNPKWYYTGYPYEPRVRDRGVKGLMRLALGNEFPVSERLGWVVQLGFTAVKESGLFFIASGDQYITFDGRVELRYKLRRN